MFNIGFTVLATIGNGLGSTRAFVIKEKVWFTGSFFGLIVGGWLTAVVVWKVRPEQCPAWALISYTVFLDSLICTRRQGQWKSKAGNLVQASRVSF